MTNTTDLTLSLARRLREIAVNPNVSVNDRLTAEEAASTLDRQQAMLSRAHGLLWGNNDPHEIRWIQDYETLFEFVSVPEPEQELPDTETGWVSHRAPRASCCKSHQAWERIFQAVEAAEKELGITIDLIGFDSAHVAEMYEVTHEQAQDAISNACISQSDIVNSQCNDLISNYLLPE